jgi:hypothetical protein
VRSSLATTITGGTYGSDQPSPVELNRISVKTEFNQKESEELVKGTKRNRCNVVETDNGVDSE